MNSTPSVPAKAARYSFASDLMIAATAASNQLPLYTVNSDDFKGAEGLVEVVGLQARPNNL
jgi:predicted nucleic acid-binding protein